MPLSPLESAKRAFVSLLLRLGRSHGVPLQISRQSPDPDLLKAYRRISKKVHPDRGGSLAESQNLNASKDAWEEARQKSKCPGRPAQENTEEHKFGSGPLVVASNRGFRIGSVAVLLTYQGFKDSAMEGEVLDRHFGNQCGTGPPWAFDAAVPFSSGLAGVQVYLRDRDAKRSNKRGRTD